MTDELAIEGLDEDLFNFGVAAHADHGIGEDEEDLESIFAAFQAEEAEQAPPIAPPIAVADPAPAFAPSPQPDASSTSMMAPSVPPPTESAAPNKDSPTSASPPVAVASAAAPSGAAGLSKSILVILIAVTLLNVMVAVVALRNGAMIRNSVLDVRREMTRTAEDIRQGAIDSAVELVAARKPLVPPDPNDHPTFEWAAAAIERREFSQARQRIYSLLSVVDSLEESERSVVEARAQYLLAEASHLEAVARMSGTP